MHKKAKFGNNKNYKIFPKEVFSLIKKVEICGVDTSKLPVLSGEEKNELLNKIKNGNEEARDNIYKMET